MIPISSPSLGDHERDNLIAAFDSTWISSRGRFIEAFEEQFANRCNASSAVTVANGTVALHLALLALGISVGDEVIIPALTYVATANAVLYCGAVPICVDVDADDWCIDAEALEDAITDRTVGILSVDIYGQPCDYAAIRDIVERHGLWWVSDSAEALFAEYDGRVVGADADVTTFSFFGNKVITCGEGGCVTTRNGELAEKIRVLKNQGNHPTRRYFHEVLGYNYRLTNLHAAILMAQLQRVDDLLAQRQRVIAAYEEKLVNPQIRFQVVRQNVKRSPWMMSLILLGHDRLERQMVIDEMALSGVETRPFFEPIHHLPYLKTNNRNQLPRTERLSAAGLCLPTYPDLTEQEIDHIVTTLDRVLSRSQDLP